ncbi:uncharacterized protein ACA1_068890 [Acanthamoeba castellanii str. Neff]|uniref:DUF4773 domain-containing protein n=1 Tax=Acanthamoeba castellanii (strain ATCC 30010 / Neff) TaxID=1257118 RepID=L8HDN4_ACACF|nr:uncharacterized protein ACA1_068890 [Acanthamoeba castellanii str. Neff]ELR23305.1 hypothetical protein ACA1_068890 [Acanthamoeba castellanii str. Neff]
MKICVVALVLVFVAVAAAAFPAKFIADDQRPANKWNPPQCNTTGYSFNCCDQLDFTVTIPFEGKVHINDSVCASLVVDPKSLNATVTLIIDGAVLYKDTFSVYDLADVCVPIQFGVSICLNWSNVVWNSATEDLSGCADIAAEVAGITIFDLPLGCFKLHV